DHVIGRGSAIYQDGTAGDGVFLGKHFDIVDECRFSRTSRSYDGDRVPRTEGYPIKPFFLTAPVGAGKDRKFGKLNALHTQYDCTCADIIFQFGKIIILIVTIIISRVSLKG